LVWVCDFCEFSGAEFLGEFSSEIGMRMILSLRMFYTTQFLDSSPFAGLYFRVFGLGLALVIGLCLGSFEGFF
jgi:hypothetical protein